MIVALAAMIVLQGAALEPANPTSNPGVRATLEYLVGLSSKKENRVLSGQFTDYGPGARIDLCAEVFKKSGQWPAMIGLDYADYTRGEHRLHTGPSTRLRSITPARGVSSRSASTCRIRPNLVRGA